MKKAGMAVCIAIALVLAGCSAAGPSSAAGSAGNPGGSGSSASESENHALGTVEEGIPDAVVEQVLPADVSAVAGGVTVKVDPLLEMLSVVMYLSDYHAQWGLLSHQKTSYQEDLDAAFSDYADHEAVRFLNDEMRFGFAFDSPPTACLYIEKDFSVSRDYEGSLYDLYRMSADMDVFRDVMESFFYETGFGEFFESHEAFYQSMVGAYVQDFPQWDMAGAMEAYYGKAMAGKTIVLVPLFHAGGFGPALEREDGTHIYSILGPKAAAEDLPRFGDRDAVTELVLHEFGHSFIPINEEDNQAMQHEVERSAYLMAPIREDMASMAYDGWATAYEELVLRAVVIDILVRGTGTAPEPLLQAERDNGFVYIDLVYKTLGRYSENRAEYPSFDAFIPVITDALMEGYPEM